LRAYYVKRELMDWSRAGAQDSALFRDPFSRECLLSSGSTQEL